MNLLLKFFCGWCLIVVTNLAVSAHAQLAEDNVLLLWNSQDSESSQIAATYLAVHPNVHSFDLNINYADYPPNSQVNPNCTCQGCDCDSTCSECECCSCPNFAIGLPQHPNPNMAMNRFYITPEMYEQHIREPLLAYIANFGEPYGAEPILAIVTTRGIPSTVSKSFDSAVNHISGPTENTCIKGSLEMHLAVLGYTSTLLVNRILVT